jgi:hypothetical protein
LPIIGWDILEDIDIFDDIDISLTLYIYLHRITDTISGLFFLVPGRYLAKISGKYHHSILTIANSIDGEDDGISFEHIIG